MNENTFVGNVSKVENFRHTRNGDSELTFAIALQDGYYDRNGRYISTPPVFQKVVVYRDLAMHLKAAFDAHEKNGVGMGLVVVGKLQDDSWTPTGSQYPVRQTKVIATIAGPDLRWATALVTKVGKTDAEQGQQANREQLAAVA
jgi:single-strand DNA-binding protein